MMTVCSWATSRRCGRSRAAWTPWFHCAGARQHLPVGVEQVDVRLVDQADANHNLDFVLLDTVRLVEQLRRDGRAVLIHCVQAQGRTPTVAALYGA
jgi:ADP-ribosyl-[dinitrogen reductase] hydrolase